MGRGTETPETLQAPSFVGKGVWQQVLGSGACRLPREEAVLA